MDYLLWLILLFVGMFMKCLGALLAFGVVYYVFITYIEGKDKEMKDALKGDK